MLTSQANAAHKIGLTPNRISIIGFILVLASAASYALTTTQTLWLLVLAVVFLFKVLLFTCYALSSVKKPGSQLQF